MYKCYIDTETTGINPHKNSIHQIACIFELENGKSSKIDLKFQPDWNFKVEKEAIGVSGLSIEKLKERKMLHKEAIMKFDSILNKFSQNMNGRKWFFIAYNAKFDYDFIIADFQKVFGEKEGCKKFFSYFYTPFIDIMSLSGLMLSDVRHKMKNFKLETVYSMMQFLGLIEEDKNKSNFHDALYDIEILRKIEKCCLKNLHKLEKLIN